MHPIPHRGLLVVVAACAGLLAAVQPVQAACPVQGCGPCEQCQGEQCVPVPPVCATNADCDGGDVCVVDPQAACNKICAQPCAVDGDCAPCDVCHCAGGAPGGATCGCVPAEVACYGDADCGKGRTCKPDPGGPCKNQCQTACQTDGDCGACGKCSGGLCQGQPVCLADADCPGGQVCELDPAQACKNACGPGPCQVDADCGPCGACNSGGCQSVAPACTQDADCGAGKACQVDAAAPCKNQCVALQCQVDADCGPCGACQGGGCQSAAPKCLADGDCPLGQQCAVDLAQPCNNECVAPPCQVDGDCGGGCAACVQGGCQVLTPQCQQESDCPVGQTCQFDPALGCKNECVAKPCELDADCGACHTCSQGLCKAIPPACTQDAQCAAGLVCEVDVTAPCLNACKAKKCANDAECGACQGCKDGLCVTVPPACEIDGDCAAGLACVVDPAQPCAAKCGPKPCAKDGDCFGCQSCQAGLCQTVTPECTSAADCAKGQACHVHPTAPCQNQCQTQCAAASDCGACGLCLDGWCQGEPVCTALGGCGVGQTCQVDANQPCQNACVAATCQTSGDCGPCHTCTSGKCEAVAPACQADADCGAGKKCLLDAQQPCKNACVPAVCQKDADCGGCGQCQAGGCLTLQAQCGVDADCGVGQACQLDAQLACKNACVAKPCQFAADCPSCFGCSEGACAELPVACTADSDCGPGLACLQPDAAEPCQNACGVPPQCAQDLDCGPCGVCQQGKCGTLPVPCSADTDCPIGEVCLTDAAAPCQNACGKPPCQADADCGPCGLCLAGKCGVLPPKCVNDAGCPADQVCLVDNAAPCNNACVYPPCVTDANCSECAQCVAGGCVPDAPGCVADTDCEPGLKCAPDPKKPCHQVCQAAGCAKSEDCGDCGVCVAGKCEASQVPCAVDQDCGAGEVCQIAAQPCLNACVGIETDAGPTDAAADAGEPDAGPTDAGAPDTAGAAADVGAADTKADAATADADADSAVQPGDAGSDAGDEDIEEPETYQPPKEATCTASQRAPRSAAAGWLLALAALGVGLARRRVARAR